MTTVKPSDKLSFHDLLSQLTFDKSCKLIGEEGRKWILRASHREIDVLNHFRLQPNQLQVDFLAPTGEVEATTTLSRRIDIRGQLHWMCGTCDGACEHVGAMFSLVLENKMQLGLAALPDERKARVDLSESAVVTQALNERRERAKKERMRIRSTNAGSPWADYTVTSLHSGKTYRVALRGLESGQSYCSCPDFRTNTLGTCKHVMKVVAGVKKRFTARQLSRPFKFKQIEVHLRYDGDITLRVASPTDLPEEAAQLIEPLCCGDCEKWTPWSSTIISIRTQRNSFSSGCTKRASGTKSPRCARIPTTIPCAPRSSSRLCCRINSTVLPLSPGQVELSWPTTWVWERRFREWGSASFWLAKPTSARS
jgi:hypothetical protein